MRVKTLLSSTAATAALTIALAPGGLSAAHDDWSPWSVATPVAEVNSPFADGCP